MMSSASRTATAAPESSPATVWLGIGTNLGDRAANVRAALAGIAALGQVEAVSDIYESAPFGHADQPDFWNLAVRLRTFHAPRALLEALQSLESGIGRTPTFRMGPRIIDIDILLYDDDVVDEPGLRIPHPGILERSFVILPLLDLDPHITHPVSGVALADVHAATRVVSLGSAAEVLGDW